MLCSYALISLKFTSFQLGKLPFLLGNLWNITGGLAVHRYFWKVQLISLPFMTVLFDKLPHLYGKFSIIPVVHLYVRIFYVQLHFKIIYYNIYIGFYTFCYNKYLSLYHLMSHIYITPFDWLFFHNFSVFLLVFLFQISDLISANSLLFRIHFTKIIPCSLTLSYFENISSLL